MTPLFRKKLALPFVALIGIVIAVAMIKLQPNMKHELRQHVASPALYIESKQENIRPSILGSGVVEPDVFLSATAEVTGRVTYIHPQLKKGTIFGKDTVVLKIDDKDYQLALRQAEADLLANQASLKQLEISVENTKLDLKLANKKLAVVKKDYQRKKSLNANGSVSSSALDAQEQQYLQQQQEVQNLSGKLLTFPADIEVLRAKIAISNAKVAQAERDIERTEVKIPFNGRIHKVNVEGDQFVSKNVVLFEASGIDKMIINAQFQLEDFRRLLSSVDRELFKFEQLLDPSFASELLIQAGLKAHILSGAQFRWDAKVERISDDLDPQTRTVGVIVSVSNNFKALNPKVRPPLIKGMYLSVSLTGISQPLIAVPRSALHQNEVFLIDNNERLLRQTIDPTYLVGNFALIKKGLNHGDRIITSDIYPAVSGKSILATFDKAQTLQINEFIEQNKKQALESDETHLAVEGQ